MKYGFFCSSTWPSTASKQPHSPPPTSSNAAPHNKRPNIVDQPKRRDPATQCSVGAQTRRGRRTNELSDAAAVNLLPPREERVGRARVRLKAACNCQGFGALPGVELCFPSLSVVDLIGSSRPHSLFSGCGPANGLADRPL